MVVRMNIGMVFRMAVMRKEGERLAARTAVRTAIRTAVRMADGTAVRMAVATALGLAAISISGRIAGQLLDTIKLHNTFR